MKEWAFPQNGRWIPLPQKNVPHRVPDAVEPLLNIVPEMTRILCLLCFIYGRRCFPFFYTPNSHRKRKIKMILKFYDHLEESYSLSLHFSFFSTLLSCVSLCFFLPRSPAAALFFLAYSVGFVPWLNLAFTARVACLHLLLSSLRLSLLPLLSLLLHLQNHFLFFVSPLFLAPAPCWSSSSSSSSLRRRS